MECCTCYESEVGLVICANRHRVCKDCLDKIESESCPLCRQTMTLPKELQEKITENRERTRNMALLQEIHRDLVHTILMVIQSYGIPKNSLPDELVLILPEGSIENFESTALNNILLQIKKFSLDRNYTLKKHPYSTLEIIRGKYSVKDVLSLPRID